MKILVVDDEPEIRDILGFMFQIEIDAEIIFANNGKEAISILGPDCDVDLVVCDYNMPHLHGGEVYTHLLKNSFKIPYVLSSSEYPDDHKEYSDRSLLINHIIKPALEEGVTSTLKAYRKYISDEGMGDDKKAKKQLNEYVSIGFDLVKLFPKAPGNIYSGDDKETLLFEKGATLDLSKLEEVKGQNLYVKQGETFYFINTLIANIIPLLNNKKDANVNVSMDSHSIIMQTVDNLGFSEEILTLTQKSVDYTLEVFKNAPKLKKLEQQVFSSQENYLTKHSVALAFTCCGLLKNLPWNSSDNLDKLVFASFLHDSTIKDRNFKEVGLTKQELEESPNFKNHPQDCVKILSQFKTLSPDIFTIVEEHHELPDGSGFPRGIGASQLRPLSSLFIFSHIVVDIMMELMDKKEDISKEKILAKLNREDFQTGNFIRCFQALEETDLFDNQE